jgi:hypothetical protein
MMITRINATLSAYDGDGWPTADEEFIAYCTERLRAAYPQAELSTVTAAVGCTHVFAYTASGPDDDATTELTALCAQDWWEEFCAQGGHRVYRITNCNGLTGRAWDAEYSSQTEANAALVKALGWGGLLPIRRVYRRWRDRSPRRDIRGVRLPDARRTRWRRGWCVRAADHVVRAGRHRGGPMTAAMQGENLRLWQECEAATLVGPDAKLRWALGNMTAHELGVIARAVLFLPFDPVNPADAKLRRRRRTMTASAIPHPTDDTGRWTCVPGFSGTAPLQIPVRWSTDRSPILTPSQAATMELVIQAMTEVNRHPWLAHTPVGAAAEPRIHRGVCMGCQRQAEEVSALVSVPWAGRTLSREYYL